MRGIVTVWIRSVVELVSVVRDPIDDVVCFKMREWGGYPAFAMDSTGGGGGVALQGRNGGVAKASSCKVGLRSVLVQTTLVRRSRAQTALFIISSNRSCG